MQTFKPTCAKCEHHSPGWCKRYAAIIRNSEPVTRCERRKVSADIPVDFAGVQATRAAMAGSDMAAYVGDTYRGR